MAWLDDQLKSDTWKRYSSDSRRSAHLIDWPVKKVLKEYEMISNWLANRECLLTGESSINIHAFRLRREDIRCPYRRQENKKEIPPSTKTSPAEVSLSEKCWRGFSAFYVTQFWKPAPARYFICLLLKCNKKRHNFHTWIYSIFSLTIVFQ